MKRHFSAFSALSAFAAAVAVVGSSAALCACTPRNEIIKIYNAGDYIDETLLDEFEEWYAEETGKNIKVVYDTFDTNESMIMRIEVLKSDYDLVCPSDYMAERMIKSGLVQKIDRSIFDNTREGLFYDGLMDTVRLFDADAEYFVPYAWGTFGIMYDTDHIAPGSDDMKSWSAMWSPEYKKRILMKDSVRDAYSVALIYKNRDELSRLSDGFTDYNAGYKTALEAIFADISDSSIGAAQSALIEQKSMLYKYEVDDGKNDMLAGTTEAWLGLFWSCDVGLIMQEDDGKHFYYEVPKEGSNVWVDGWVIPKYAENTEAANYFLKFINEHEYAKTNFEYLGSSVSVKSVMDEGKEELIEDEDGFFDGTYDGFKQMYIDMIFPPADVLARCSVMRDFGAKMNTELDSMWIDVKTS
ncbi:MAG: ABC transporter substrate-binding protein [Roseburia sp.]|nr:ABC transporter substrate-binding protein [Roseburia sp.]